MSFLKIKMDLKFPALPLIYAYIQSDYNKCETMSDYINFVHNCEAIADATKNEVKKDAYSKTAKTVYGLITGKTYESSFPKSI